MNPSAVAAMAERGIDISHEFPKPWTDETVRAADVVVTMGCGVYAIYSNGWSYFIGIISCLSFCVPPPPFSPVSGSKMPILITLSSAAA